MIGLAANPGTDVEPMWWTMARAEPSACKRRPWPAANRGHSGSYAAKITGIGGGTTGPFAKRSDRFSQFATGPTRNSDADRVARTGSRIFTLPWRGRVAHRRCAGWGARRCRESQRAMRAFTPSRRPSRSRRSASAFFTYKDGGRRPPIDLPPPGEGNRGPPQWALHTPPPRWLNGS
jgi:hypothetical protein